LEISKLIIYKKNNEILATQVRQSEDDIKYLKDKIKSLSQIDKLNDKLEL
jgi:hypothetical protein